MPFVSETSEALLCNGDTEPSERCRWTRKDIPRLEAIEVVRKICGPDNLDKFFGEDGFMDPKMQRLLESVTIKHPCRMCQKLTNSKCSRCKMVCYCSRTCQKSHWSTHKPACGFHKDPVNVKLGETTNFSNLQAGMRTHGRKYQTLDALLDQWLNNCPHGGNLSTESMTSKHLFTLSRNNAAELEIIQEYRCKIHRSARHKDKIDIPPSAQKNVKKYITDSIQDSARAERKSARGTCIYGEFYLQEPEEIDFTKPGPYIVRRGADITFAAGKWAIVQYNPDLMQQSDEHHDGQKLPGRMYAW